MRFFSHRKQFYFSINVALTLHMNACYAIVLKTANEAHIKWIQILWILIEISIEIDYMQIQDGLVFSCYIDSSTWYAVVLALQAKVKQNGNFELKSFGDKNGRNKINLMMSFLSS